MSLRIGLSALFLVLLCAASPAAAADQRLLPAPEVQQLNSPFINIAAGAENYSGTGCFTSLTGECPGVEESASIPLHKHGNTVVWSLVPEPAKLSLDPLDVIKNTHLVLRYRF